MATRQKQKAAAAPVADDRDCYLLEFSAGSGGARRGDIHAHTDLAGLRAGFEARCAHHGEDGVDAYLVMWYGAVLHLWVVRDGEIVDGLDLHPFLRCADPAYNTALQDVLDTHDDDDFREFFDAVIEAYPFRTAAVLPLLARGLELTEAAMLGDDAASDELDSLSDELAAAVAERRDPVLPYPIISNTLTFDWEAIAAAAPPVRPGEAQGEFTFRWGTVTSPVPDSHLRHPRTLHFGVNDLECGDDQYPEQPES